ncbi:MAG TPA: putative Ig domain-containing protein [Candidatus Acidoferrum sp.]|nr:putative Ig domain-containing protein [Candidatus Acidoferrum sp.]
MSLKLTVSHLLALLALAGLNSQRSTAHAAVTFTVTPSAVSNTYNGQITLQVAGLASGGTVVVQKFLDVNTNGVIDANDLLVQQFSMTDGHAGIAFGGVTNLNVPGDTDTTAGQITAKLNFYNGDFMQTVAGKYLYKVSGNFTPPITNAFTVTNFPWSQKITGNVVSNSTSTTLSNAFVLLMPGPDTSPIAGVVADRSGGYTIPVPPGSYLAAAFRSNYLCDFSALSAVTVSSGATVTTNLSLTVATTNISGKVVDSTNSSLGLPGILVTARSDSGPMGIGFSDTNGNFNVRVQSGQWTTKADDTSLIVHGYLGLEDGTNVAPGPTAITIGVPKATALIYGSVKDGLGNPLAGIDVYTDDGGQHLYQTDGYTGTNGTYFLAVLSSATNDSWWMQASGSTNYVFSQPQWDGVVTNSTAVLQNVTALLATNHITGNVTCNGTNVPGVGVMASATIGGAYYSQYVDADAHGNFWLNVANSNQWTVGLEDYGGDDSLDTILGPGKYLPPNNQTVGVTNNNVVTNFTLFVTTNHITGHIQRSNGNPIIGLGVGARATLGGEDYMLYVDTDGSGNYSLNVCNGSWTVGLNPSYGGDSLDSILGAGNYAPPDNQTVTITNHDSTNDFTIQPCAGIQVLTTNLPPGEVGLYYDQFVAAESCRSGLAWSVLSGSLPPGLTADLGSGEIYGTPTNAGAFSFTIQVTDDASDTTNQALSLAIVSALQVTTASLFNGTNGTAYSQQLYYAGGLPPCQWSLSPGSSNLPPNLTLATDGLLSGTPAAIGTFNFSVRATDSATATADQSLSLKIAAQPLQITTTTLPNATQGTFYTATLAASGGQPPYAWSLAPGSGSPPPNLTLGTDGVLSGTPASSGTNWFIARVTDAAASTMNQLLSLAVRPPTTKPVISITGVRWLTGGEFQFSFNTSANTSYSIQCSSNLTDWNPVLTLSGSGAPMTIIDPGTAGSSRRFYRVKTEL